jgi:glutamate N-acetyltransferase/amino-acid N-acetyltransferase
MNTSAPKTLPAGFLFSACTAGIKASGRPDLALALAPDGASAAAMFTRNQVVAAPLILDREHLRFTRGHVHAVIVNAGNANCATGADGLRAAKTVCRELAKSVKVKTQQVFPSSTGIIGVRFPVEKITAALPKLIAGANAEPHAFAGFATAIMTTDTRMKTCAEEISSKTGFVRIVGVAKGAGMIHPNVATMLVYLFTDVEAAPGELRKCLNLVADQTFNAISIDGDTSTNDTVLLLASGQSGVQLKSLPAQFQEKLQRVCSSLAQQIVADGEGVKHVVRLRVEQARRVDEARQIARTIANSALVKTAWAGSDPNWGRMLGAIGYSGVRVDPAKISIYLGDQLICRRGAAVPFDRDRAHRYMSQDAYDIRITLGLGRSHLEFFSCDLTQEYVHINADYST